MRRILITGANGFVAGSIIKQAMNEWEIHGIVRKEVPAEPTAVNYIPLDIVDRKTLEQLIKKINPDIYNFYL